MIFLWCIIVSKLIKNSLFSGSIFGETIEDAIADFVVDEEVVIFEEKDFLEYLTNTNTSKVIFCFQFNYD